MLFDPASLSPHALLPAFIGCVRDVGYARLHDTIAAEAAARLRRHISDELQSVLSDTTERSRRLSTIRAPVARYDLALDPFSHEVSAACGPTMAVVAALATALVRADGDEDDEPLLVEFGALISDASGPNAVLTHTT